jgi:hypothetical protein
MQVLWCDALSESCRFIGEGYGIFSNSIIVDGLGAYGAVHNNGCWEYKDYAYFTESSVCPDA